MTERKRSRKGGEAIPPSRIVEAVGHASGRSYDAGAGSVAAGAGMAKGRDRLVLGRSIGHREIDARLQREFALEQAREAGGKNKQARLAASLAAEHRPYIERYQRRLHEGMPKLVAQKLALGEMKAAGLKELKSERGVQNMFDRWENRKSA